MKPMIRNFTWRSLFLVAALLYAFVLVIGSTYAWTTYSDERINRTETEKVTLDLELVGEQSTMALDYQKEHVRNLRVKNKNRTPAIVRVSLEELLLAFDIDLDEGTGTGNVRSYAANDAKNGPVIKKEEPTSWQVNGFLANADGTFKKAVKRSEANFLKNQTRQVPFSSIHLKMPNVIDANPGLNGKVENKWVYQEEIVDGKLKGFFYYSDVLYNQQETTVLVEDVRVKAVASGDTVLENQYKASLYTLNAQLEGGLANIEMLKMWNHAQNSTIAKIYQQKLQGSW